MNELSRTEQPPIVEIYMADGVFIKQMLIAKSGTFIPQHAHEYDHTSMLARGAVRLWIDGRLIGDRQAPCGIMILANVKHLFQALEDDTLIYCIHNVSRTGIVEIADEHSLGI